MLTLADLEPFAAIEPVKAQAMIDDATATALQVAPCLADADTDTLAAAKAIVRRAVLRWNDAGSGAVTQVSALSFSQTLDTRSVSPRGLLFPSEVKELQGLCASPDAGKAFSVDTVSPWAVRHPATCALTQGGTACSCGAALLL